MESTSEEGAKEGPSIIEHINEMYSAAVAEIWKIVYFEIPPDQATTIKRILCSKVHVILTMEHVYCFEVFKEALPKHVPFYQDVIWNAKNRVAEQNSKRWFTLEKECESIGKLPPS